MAYVVRGLLPDPNEHHQIFIRVSASDQSIHFSLRTYLLVGLGHTKGQDKSLVEADTRLQGVSNQDTATPP